MQFHWSFATILISVAVLLLTVVCCWISWRRSGYARHLGWLELLRFALVAMVVLTLNQPEFHEEILPEHRPALVVLHDASASMKTRDVRDPADPAAAATSRLDAIQPYVTADVWKNLSARMDVVVEPFSSTTQNPEMATDLNAALQNAVDRHPGLRGVVLLTDGDWNHGGTPATAATELRMKNAPVYAIAVGSDQRLPDVELAAADAPTFGVAGKPIRIPFRIVSWLPEDHDITVSLTGTGGAAVQKTVRVQGMGRIQDTLEWRPETTGDYDLTLAIPVEDQETIADNNELSFPISIRNEELRVLVVESYPRWEYRYLRNALERDPGVDVNCLLFHPDLEAVGGGRGYLEQFPAEADLLKYDVVFLGDVGVSPDQLTLDDCRALRQLVRTHAGGLVFLPGFRGRQATLLGTELEELMPVIPDPANPRGFGTNRPGRFQLTEAGRRSLLTRLESTDESNEVTWAALPGFYWYAASHRARIGSQVLATHDSATSPAGRVPLIATRTSGTGKVLFMGTDAAWRWRKGVEDLYHYRFWGQVVRWMAYQRNMSSGEAMRLFYSPDRPEAGNVLNLNANVMSGTGDPLRDGTVVAQIISPSGQTDSVRLAPAGEDSWGLFSGTFVPTEGGPYRVVTTCAETGGRLETSIAVIGQEKELAGQPARSDVLREIAEISRGQLTTIHDAEVLVKQLEELPEPAPVIRPFRLWSHPLWAGAIVLLLGLFWTGRKLAGLA